MVSYKKEVSTNQQASLLHRSQPFSAKATIVRNKAGSASSDRNPETGGGSQRRPPDVASADSPGANWFGGLVDACGKLVAECGTLVDAWGNAFADCGGGGRGGGGGGGRRRAEYKIIRTANRRVKVPCGRAVTELEWASLEARTTIRATATATNVTNATNATASTTTTTAAAVRAVRFKDRDTVSCCCCCCCWCC